MSLPSFVLPHDMRFLDPFRNALFKSFSISPISPWERAVKIMHVDRQASGRRLRTEDHHGLLGVIAQICLKAQTLVTFIHARLREMDKRSQIGALSGADVGT
jgi:hypothetical protein